jgi:hypothetical protein
MAIEKIKIDYSRHSDEELLVAALIIVSMMTANSNFTSPTPTIPVVQTSLTAFTVAYVKAAYGGVILTQTKNDARDALITLLVALAGYVQPLCTTIVIAQSSGYNLASTNRTKVGPLDKILLLHFKDGPVSGSEEISIDKAIPNASSYLYMYTQSTALPQVWITTPCTKGKIIARGLIVGQPLIAKAAAIGADETIVWSDEFTLDLVR